MKMRFLPALLFVFCLSLLMVFSSGPAARAESLYISGGGGGGGGGVDGSSMGHGGGGGAGGFFKDAPYAGKGGAGRAQGAKAGGSGGIPSSNGVYHGWSGLDGGAGGGGGRNPELAGADGYGAMNDNGGAGGRAQYLQDRGAAWEDLSLYGGNAGADGAGAWDVYGRGGSGGEAEYYQLQGDLVITGRLLMQAGAAAGSTGSMSGGDAFLGAAERLVARGAGDAAWDLRNGPRGAAEGSRVGLNVNELVNERDGQLNVTATGNSYSSGHGAYEIRIDALHAKGGNLSLDLTNRAVSGGDSVDLGHYIIDAGRTLTISGTQGSHYSRAPGSGIRAGLGSTLNADFGGQAADFIEFDLAGAGTGATILTSSHMISTNEVRLLNADHLLGLTSVITLSSNTGSLPSPPTNENLTIFDSFGNSGLLSGVTMALNGPSLQLQNVGDSFAADGDWQMAGHLTLGAGQSYTVPGRLALNGRDVTVSNSSRFETGEIWAVNGDSRLDFSAGLAAGNSLDEIVIGDGLDGQGEDGPGRTLIILGRGGDNYAGDLRQIQVYGRNHRLQASNISTESLSFNLPAGTAANDVFLTYVNGDLALTYSHNMYMQASAPLRRLQKGDTITLVDGVSGRNSDPDWQVAQQHVTYGGAILYEFDVFVNGNNPAHDQLLATLTGSSLEDGMAHNALLSASALHLLLSQGGDRAAGAAGNFRPAGAGPDQAGAQAGFFMDLGGGHYELKTNSHVESDSFHLLAGPGLRFSHQNGGKTDLGLFFEAGWGNFDTYNSFYRGDGDTSYYGAGLLARHDFPCGFYGEGSLRLGHAKSDYDSDYDTNYEISSSYYGGHVGAGYVLPVSAAGSLDFSGKFLFTRLEGDSSTNDAGDRMKVGDTDSYRTQLGVRYAHRLNERFGAFAGAAWEYEFDGETSGEYNQLPISKTDPSGSSGLGEIGLNWLAADNFSIDLSAHGLVGQREGYGGSFSLKLEF